LSPIFDQGEDAFLVADAALLAGGGEDGVVVAESHLDGEAAHPLKIFLCGLGQAALLDDLDLSRLAVGLGKDHAGSVAKPSRQRPFRTAEKNRRKGLHI